MAQTAAAQGGNVGAQAAQKAQIAALERRLDAAETVAYNAGAQRGALAAELASARAAAMRERELSAATIADLRAQIAASASAAATAAHAKEKSSEAFTKIILNDVQRRFSAQVVTIRPAGGGAGTSDAQTAHPRTPQQQSADALLASASVHLDSALQSADQVLDALASPFLLPLPGSSAAATTAAAAANRAEREDGLWLTRL